MEMVSVRAVRLEGNVELTRLPGVFDPLIHNMSNRYHREYYYEQNYAFSISVRYCADGIVKKNLSSDVHDQTLLAVIWILDASNVVGWICGG
jgi:hypothetical protein